MSTTSIPDELLEQLVVTYLKGHTHIPGAWAVIEHLERSRDSEDHVQIPGFNSDLTTRLTRMYNDDTNSEMYRLRIYHPINEQVVTIYFMIQGRVVSYYTFSDRVSYREYDLVFRGFLGALITIPLNMIRTSLDEFDFTYRFEIRRNRVHSDDQIYHLSDFPTWRKLTT